MKAELIWVNFKILFPFILFSKQNFEVDIAISISWLRRQFHKGWETIQLVGIETQINQIPRPDFFPPYDKDGGCTTTAGGGQHDVC